MTPLTFFQTTYYKNYKQKIDSLNYKHFQNIYFEVELDALYNKFEEDASYGRIEEKVHDEIVRQYDRLHSFFLAGSIKDEELSVAMFDENGNEIEFE